MRILISSPRKRLVEEIKRRMVEEGYLVDETFSLRDASAYFQYRNFDLIIVDEEEGRPKLYNFLVETREQLPFTKIIVIGAGELGIEEEIKLLRVGADDLIREPLHYGLLSARVKAHFRHWEGNILKIDNLKIKRLEEKVLYKGKSTDLKGKAFEVFLYLAEHPNQVFSKEQLLHSLWKEPDLVTPNVVEVAINHIRKKVDKVFKIVTIETIRRRGYKFCYPNKKKE